MRHRILPALLVAAAGCAGGLLVWACDPRAPALNVRLADEATITADRPSQLTLFRFRPNPAVLVLDFPGLADQGRMLNRIAALIEKCRVPHDHVLDDAALAAAIRAGGDTPETWYYGHDYRIDDIDRFFALADRDGVTLDADEQRLRRLLRQMRGRPAIRALISLPGRDPAHDVDDAARAAILHHELSHGDYFSQPAYAAYAGGFWREVLTDAERVALRGYLRADGYDPGIEDLMVNEAQAYLIFTPDRHFFMPEQSGFGSARLAELRRRFATGLLLAPAAEQPMGLMADLYRMTMPP